MNQHDDAARIPVRKLQRVPELRDRVLRRREAAEVQHQVELHRAAVLRRRVGPQLLEPGGDATDGNLLAGQGVEELRHGKNGLDRAPGAQGSRQA